MNKFNVGDLFGVLVLVEIGQYLIDIGDLDVVWFYMQGVVQGQVIFGIKILYKYLGFVLGFIQFGVVGLMVDIQVVSWVEGDKDLILKWIKIFFDKFYVDDYLGWGVYNVFCEFFGSNQVVKEVELLQFVLCFCCNDKVSVSQQGVLFFLGVIVGKDGILFEGCMINVFSDMDEILLSMLDSLLFQNGLLLFVIV